MTHPSVNSIVERLIAFGYSLANDDADLIDEAATIISELQAERVDKATAWDAVAEKNAEIADLRSRIKRLSDALLAARPLGGSELFVRWGDGFHADPEFFKDALERDKARYHEAMKRAVTAEKKLATAESSLSRIKAETIEALSPFADALLDVDDAAGDEWHLWESPAALNLSVGDLRRANTAIRSLGSTGGAEKTAESGNPAPTRECE